jgi:signal transduction histidine kinase
MKCPRCEQENPVPDAQFCPRCGAPVTRPEDSSPPAVSLADLQRALREALDQQTATSEILQVIASSPTDTQPVFDTIVGSAATLCHAAVTAVFLTDGKMVFLPANYGSSPEALGVNRAQFPRPLDMESSGGIAIMTGSVVHVPDSEEPSVGELVRQNGRRLGFRSLITVPMLRDGAAVGAIGVYRREPGRFSDAEVALLQTFADQAVIAIENVRLFNELGARNGDLTEALEQQVATAEILRVISASPTDLQPVFDAIAHSAVRLCSGVFGVVYRLEGVIVHLVAHHNFNPEAWASYQAMHPMPVSRSNTSGRAMLDACVAFTEDTETDVERSSAGRRVALAVGARSVVSVPMLRDGRSVGAITVARREPGRFSDKQVALLQTFADQAVIAIENVRLFTELQERNHEVEQKSHELAAASQHKSEFLANMSHELRTPLNAIIGFSEVLGERMFGELNEKQGEYLKDIHGSGQHLLSLINDILDLSKIEAGRMELEVTDFHLPTAIDNSLTLIRERAVRHGITLHQQIDPRLGRIQGDERKIKQVLLNLLSNAIKFTPEGGRIEVRAKPVNGSVEVSVSDTGVGIAPEDQEAIFEEFRQVGTADKKVEGTGLGLALSRKFIELHGGRIWVTSRVGVGSTFTFTIPCTVVNE